MSERLSTYAEKTLLRLPAGTRDAVRRKAEALRTSPAEVMRRAISQYVEPERKDERAEAT